MNKRNVLIILNDIKEKVEENTSKEELLNFINSQENIIKTKLNSDKASEYIDSLMEDLK